MVGLVVLHNHHIQSIDPQYLWLIVWYLGARFPE